MTSVSKSKNKNDEIESDSGSESGSDIDSISRSETGNISDIEPQQTVESGESQGKSGIVSNILQSVGQFLLSILLSIVTGFFNFLKSNWIILLIFGIIGFTIYYIYSNAMNFLSSFTDLFKNILPLISSTSNILGSTISKTTNDTPNTSGTPNASTTSSSDSTDKINSLTKPTYLDTYKTSEDTLETTLKAPDKKQNIIPNNDNSIDTDNSERDNNESHDIETHDNSFNTDNLTPSNNNHETGLEGYCFIGTDNGVRTCAPVGKNNKCMSGEIFPSLQICMDPKLRE